MNVYRILDIDHIEGIFRTKFEICLDWKEERRKYFNLKNESRLNVLKEGDLNVTWTPQLDLKDLYVRFRETHEPESVSARIENETDYRKDVVENDFFYDGDNVVLQWSIVQRCVQLPCSNV